MMTSYAVFFSLSLLLGVQISLHHPVLKHFKSWDGKAHLVNVKQ